MGQIGRDIEKLITSRIGRSRMNISAMVGYGYTVDGYTQYRIDIRQCLQRHLLYTLIILQLLKNLDDQRTDLFNGYSIV
ncbi:hypothetical protein WN48_03393 [Eufriesea mexicana]|uniref:Uncharacterized protein n=1 Tax=Eufriesea mexicana TaxID=516756 RepID=A0A310SJK3_9HYME|nr:hypothetical protein WN48_03393 [Eufriesea mexicana]